MEQRNWFELPAVTVLSILSKHLTELPYRFSQQVKLKQFNSQFVNGGHTCTYKGILCVLFFSTIVLYDMLHLLIPS